MRFIYYYVIWMCAEASTVLRAVAADFFFNCWHLEIPSDNRIGHVPRCVHCHAQGFKLKFVLHKQRDIVWPWFPSLGDAGHSETLAVRPSA
jgi:hypothetical protein